MTKTFKPGDRVRLTGAFLRSTGQFAGSEGLARWRIRLCDCGLCNDGTGRFVAVDEPTADQEGIRHFNVANLERYR